MRNYNIKIVTLLVFCLSSICCAQEKTEDPVKSFKIYLAKHFESYKSDSREQITKLGGGWVKEYYEPNLNYKIDVQKTNSLITPFTGYCEFILIRHITDFHSSKEEASNDSIFTKSNERTHKHSYGFQEDKWVVTSRSNQDQELAKIVNPLTKRSSFDTWGDCNEVIKLGSQKGETNIFGCWEKEE